MKALDGICFDPTEFVDPLFGVGSATSAGPTLPGGSIHPSPETLQKDNGGYTRNQPIVGFGQAYISGSGGTKCFGNFLLAPMVDRIELNANKRAAFAVPGTELAKCYEYQVQLENGIGVHVTPAHDAAIYRITYPAGRKALLLLDTARKLDVDACMKSGKLTVDPKNQCIYGGGLYSGNWNCIDWNMYFAAMFDTKPIEMGIFRGEQLIACRDTTETILDQKDRFGTYICFGTPLQEMEIRIKIAISFVSAARAEEYLVSEIPTFDYSKTRTSAQNAWREILGAIRLADEDPALLRRFYTAMYHMHIQPRNRTHDHGNWDDMHTIWDSWKTLFPLYSLLYPEKMGSIIDSFIDRAQKNMLNGSGIVLADQYSAGNEYLAGQGGNDVDNVIVDAFLKGVPLQKHTWDEAYSVLLASAEIMRSPEYLELGHATANHTTASGVPYSGRFHAASATQGFALNDKAIANMAEILQKTEDAKKFKERSANWVNAWNAELESEGFTGFPQNPEDDGSFAPGFDAHTGYNTHFYEATAWDASYCNYNDVPLLVKIMGGKERFIQRLLWACDHSVNYYNNDHGAEGYLNFTNEPSFHVPWLFCCDEICRPDLAAKVIDRIIKRFSLQDDYPGDEDNGGMSSYYVFMMCGFFPYATTERYYLHGTRIKEAIFQLGNGKQLRITGENTGRDNIYVKSAQWQGSPLTRCSLTHRQLMEGGHLHFIMTDIPSDWAFSG